MKIDLHVHTSNRSPCGQVTEEEQVRAAIASGLDAIAFCDHHALAPQASLDRLNREFPQLRVFGGIEVTVTEREDFIVLGIQDPALESMQWRYAELHRFVREHDGFIALAHPFRYHADIEVDLERYRPDAIEVHSWTTPLEAEPRIRTVAADLGLRLLCDSDAHATRGLGLYYNVLNRPVGSDRELVDILRRGEFRCEFVQENARRSGRR